MIELKRQGIYGLYREVEVMEESFLPEETIKMGKRLLGKDPCEFYIKTPKEFFWCKSFDKICEVCGLGPWKEGTSYNDMFLKAFDSEGARFIADLPSIMLKSVERP